MGLYHLYRRGVARSTAPICALLGLFTVCAHAQQDVISIPVHYDTPYVSFADNLRPVTQPPKALSVTPLLKQIPEQLQSEIAYVQDIESGAIIYQKNSDQIRPIASITKLMTALIVLEAKQNPNEVLEITTADIDHLKNTTSRLSVGSKLTRAEMLHLALMSSENRAANALGRHFPGGVTAFVRAMNDKARSLGMRQTRFMEPTGLSSENVSSPQDLIVLLRETAKHPQINDYTTSDQLIVEPRSKRQLIYNNTNRLVQNDKWDIQVSKTGFINEAGQCLVLMTRLEGRQVGIVLLNSQGRYSRIGDAIRLRNVVEKSNKLAML